MSPLTDFQILQLAATLASGSRSAAAGNAALVAAMFDCAALIRIKLGDTELEKAYKEEQEQKREARTVSLKATGLY